MSRKANVKIFHENENVAIANEMVETLVLKKEDILDMINNDKELGNKLLFIFLKRMHQKLNKTNERFRDKVFMEEDISNNER